MIRFPPARAASRLALGLLLAAAPLVAAAAPVVIFAAASLKTALDAVAERWAEETGGRTSISYAGSSALAQQILQGAPAEVFVSANLQWMEAVEAEGLVCEDTRRSLLGNAIVLVAHGDAPAVEIGPELDLAGLLGDGRLAMAMVDSVPAGIYGKAALESLGLWESVAGRLAQTDNVRAALALVARGEAPYGIVYASDAAAEDAVSVAGAFPDDTHPPIIYPAVLTAEAKGEEARAFLDYLSGDTARAIFEAHGFHAPGGGNSR